MSKSLAGIILLLGLLYLLGNAAVQLWDRDEPRYAQTSRQMRASGDLVVPMLLDEPRLKKPPLIYWCQAAAMSIFNNEVFAARFPSALAIVLTLVMLGLVLRRIAGPQLAIWTVVIFGTSALAIVAAKMCLTDAVLLLFVTASQLCLYAIWRGRWSWSITAALGVSMGLAILTKGPVVLGVSATTLIVLGLLRLWDRRQLHKHARRMGFEVVTPADLPEMHSLDDIPTATAVAQRTRQQSVLGIAVRVLIIVAIVLAICLPWVLALEHRIPGSLLAVFKKEVGSRMVEAAEQHKGPPGYYLLLSLATFFPWSLLMISAIKLGWINRRDELTRFSLAAVIGPWIMFEAIQTKLPHYVLPCFPFLAILTAKALIGAIRREHNEWIGKLWSLSLNIWSLALMGLGLAPWFAAMPGLKFEPLPWASMIAVTAAAGLSAGVVLAFLARGRFAAGAASMAGTMLLLFALLFGWYLPGARFLHLSEDVGRYLQSIHATTPGQITAIDYLEDTLPFYQGGTLRRQGKLTYLAQTPPEQWPQYIVLTREVYDQTPAPAKDRLEVLKTFRGWAYAAKGRVVEVLVARKRAASM